jgi:hypothetical protein
MHAIVPRHGAWRRMPMCRAMRSGAAQPDVGPARPAWQLCRVTTKGGRYLCHVVLYGAAKKD